jgi:O-antigen ligase
VPKNVALKSGKVDRQNMMSDTGFSPNTAGKMMSGVAGAILAVIPLLKKRKYRFFMLGACGTSIYILALTGSRSAYIACGATIVLLCFLRWRRYLLLLPFFIVLVLPRTLPGATKRMWSGFGVTNVAGEEITNKNTVTSGRNLIWPVVIDKIYESPFFGFGREAMRRTGLQRKLGNQYVGEGISVAHPHNGYLEVLLDSGLIGFVIIVGLHTLILLYSARLFVDRGDPLCTVAGGFALALLTGHLVAHMGGQTFYPSEIEVGLWCTIGIMLRVYVARGCLVAKVNGTFAADIRITKDITVSQTPFGWVNS